MSKAGESILRGARQALAFSKGEKRKKKSFRVHIPAEVDVRAIRKGFGMSQAEFAEAFGFSLSALRNWEQGRRTPEGPARALLVVIAKEPEAVKRALRAA